jgi:transcriptional regulator with XRE-family HTH domain
MSKPFKKLMGGMSEERQEKIKIKTDILKNELALKELRQAMELTQEELAKELHVNQAAVSKFESQSDIYISTLRKILFAMGGELRIVAHFDDGDVLINQFDDIRKGEVVAV